MCQIANFENGGTIFQFGILHVLLNSLSMSLTVYGEWLVWLFLDTKFTLGRKIISASGRLELLASI